MARHDICRRNLKLYARRLFFPRPDEDESDELPGGGSALSSDVDEVRRVRYLPFLPLPPLRAVWPEWPHRPRA